MNISEIGFNSYYSFLLHLVKVISHNEMRVDGEIIHINQIKWFQTPNLIENHFSIQLLVILASWLMQISAIARISYRGKAMFTILNNH